MNSHSVKSFFESKKLHFLFSILFFLSANVYPQENDLKDFFNTGKNLFNSPGKFNPNDWLTLSAVTVATASSFLIDEELKSFSLNNRSNFADGLFRIDDYYHVEAVIIITTGTYLYGLASRNEKTRQLGLHLAEASVYAGIINAAIKFITGRARPFTEEGESSFDFFNFDFAHTSFPSGHTTLAFAFSTVMANEHKNIFWKAGWFTASALVGAARMYNNKHWLSDVVLGAAIGYFVGDFVNKNSKNISKQENSPDNFFISYKLSF